jgi:dephospho-CoA kinase
MLRLGLTGGIGSGKSTVSAMFVTLGARLIDADAISRDLTKPQGLAMEAIRRRFGDSVITPEGALDRERMRSLAYQDTQARKQLESIIHPLVEQESARVADAALQQGASCLIHDIPLLTASSHWRPKLDRVLVVDCLPAVQVARVMARSQLPQAEVERIMAAQIPRNERLSLADAVIDNNGSGLDQLRHEVVSLYERWMLSFC